MFTIQKTQQEIVKDELREINIYSEAGLLNLIEANQVAYDKFWNSTQVTPQEFCDLMGNEAYKLFINSAESQTFIKKMKPDHEPLSIPEGVEAVFNKDGTVTITDNRNETTD